MRELLYETQISGSILSEQLLSCSFFSVYPMKASERFEMASANVAYVKQRVNKRSALANEGHVTPGRALMQSQDVNLITAEALYKAIKISRGYNMTLETVGYPLSFPLSFLSSLSRREGSYSFALWRSCRGGTLRAFTEGARYSAHRLCYDILTSSHEAFALIH